MAENVCLITGVGPGTGAALARRFAAGWLSGRDAGAERGAAAYARRGARRRARVRARRRPTTAALEATCAAVASELRPPRVVIHNAVGGAFGDFQTIDPGVLRHNFEVNTMALLTLARAVAPAMVAAGEGTILCTGNTSAHRGRRELRGLRAEQGGAAHPRRVDRAEPLATRRARRLRRRSTR